MTENQSTPPEPTPPTPTPPVPFPRGAENPRQPNDPSATDRRNFLKRERPTKTETRPVMLSPIQPFAKGVNRKQLDAEIEAELNAALSGFVGDDVMSEQQRSQPAGEGGRRKGRVVAIHSGDVYVHMPGNRAEGAIPLLQFGDEPPKVGEEVEFIITGFDSANGLLKMSKEGAAESVNWSSVRTGNIVEARVIAVNRGGLAVEVNGLPGFLPISQIEIFRVEQPEQYIGQKLLCEVTEANAYEKNLVVSRRALLEREKEAAAEKFWEKVEVGNTFDGVIRNIRPFGAFVDIGGVDGLIPVSELAWSRVDKPEEVVKLGQKVRVKVISADFEKRKLALSLRQLADNPWTNLRERHPVGSQVQGKVTRLAEYGAFVEIEPGIEGMIHVSELGNQRIRHPREVLQPEQEVEVMIMAVDPESRRLGLSLKAIEAQKQRAENANALELQKKKQQEAEEEDEDDAPAPTRRRNFNLRGGLGG